MKITEEVLELCDRGDTPWKENLFVDEDGYLYESSLARVWQHTQHGMMMVSAAKDGRSKEDNDKAHEELKKSVRSEGLGYIEGRGHSVEKKADGSKVNVREKMLIVPRPKDMDDKTFYGKGEKFRAAHNQDAVLTVNHKGHMGFLTAKGHEVGSSPVKFNPDKVGQYYSELRKGSHKDRPFVLEGISIASNYIDGMRRLREGYITL